MAEVRVTDRDGNQHTLTASNAEPLMEVLRDANLGVLGTCGGMCSCGTCHVYIGQTWLSKLHGKSDDETMMLEGIGELVEIRSNSRLSCQIPVTEDLNGLEVEIGPVA